MEYIEVIHRLNDILYRSDNNKKITLDGKDVLAIEESKIAIARLIGDYPKDFEYKRK